MLQVAISTLVDALVGGGELRIGALGRLWIQEKAARRVVSNLAGRRRVYEVRGQRVVRFRASRSVVVALNDRPSGEEPELVRECGIEVEKAIRRSRGREEAG